MHYTIFFIIYNIDFLLYKLYYINKILCLFFTIFFKIYKSSCINVIKKIEYFEYYNGVFFML